MNQIRKNSLPCQPCGKLASLPSNFLNKINIIPSLISENLPPSNRLFKNTSVSKKKNQNPPSSLLVASQLSQSKTPPHRLKSSKNDREAENIFHYLYRINSYTRIDLDNSSKLALPKINCKRRLKKPQLQDTSKISNTESKKALNSNPAKIPPVANIPSIINRREMGLKLQETKSLTSSKNLLSQFNQIDYNCFFYDPRMETLTIPQICSRKSCTFILEGNLGLIIGGMGRKTFDEAVTFNLESKTIRKQKNFLFQRTNHLTVKCGNYVFIHGGHAFMNFLNKKVLNDMFMFYWS